MTAKQNTQKRQLIFLILCIIGFLNAFAKAQAVYAPPDSPRIIYNFNPNWKFIREDMAGAEAVAFDDSKWDSISTPHSWNETDSFRKIISHSGGDTGTYKGIGWYRKHFKIPASYSGQKVFVEFEGMRQAGDIFLNGKAVGLYENGVTGYGVDISNAVHFGDSENVLAVKVDNRGDYAERATNTRYEWNANDFNPNHGGINRRVWLHIAGKIYQTLPLYYGLESTGTYIYGENYDIPGRSCDVNVESEVCNSSGDRATVVLSAVVVDSTGQVCAKFDGDPVDMVSGEKSDLHASGNLKNARFWSPANPALYEVYSILTVDGKVVDVVKSVTGFRKVEYKGGATSGGVYVNDQFVYLKGFAQRSSDEWAGLGQAYPDWMHDFSASLIRESHGNYIRWMHISPQKVDVESCDREGIVEVCPAGDKERDVQGRQWDQRVEVMRDSIIYFRNSPSILFWEAGNTVVAPDQMQQMVDLRKQWDPHGQRVIGTRGDSNNAANSATTPIAEYYGVMIGQDRQTEQLKTPTDIFRAYSTERRDRAPIIETEDFRDEGARRFWDDFTPPFFGFKKGPKDTYSWNSETFALAAAGRYFAYWNNRISNTDANHARWSGYASIYFSDSDADGRQDSSEVCRVSGKVDAVRLPKEIYFLHRVMQNDKPDIHIIGHWTYPAGVTKTINVAANNVDGVELFINDKSKGIIKTAQNGYIYAFPQIAFEPGTIRAVAYKDAKPVAEDKLETAGPASAIKLTVHTGPKGLQADGSDAAFVDVEVVDSQGRRCPTDEARIDFLLTGPAIWRGGYNSGKTDSTNNLYLDTECGINRVAIRSTSEIGTISLTARRDGLQSAMVQIESKSVKIVDGLSMESGQRLATAP